MTNWKIWVRLTAAIWLVLVLVWAGMILWQSAVNRDTAIRQARDFAGSIHEMTMAGLTGMMITGTVDQREVFLDQIKQLSIIKDLHVARSKAVSDTYGEDKKSSRQLDAVEQQVMASGQAHVRAENAGDASYLHVVTPTRAARNYLGKDCLTCHQVPEGAGPAVRANVGPRLDAARLAGWDRARLRALLDDPMRANPDTVMPPFGRHRILEPAEIERIIDYLHALP